ncbi:MAG: sodium:solute symporter [Bacteroidota bacterium]
MTKLDWIVLALTLTCIICYGLYKSKHSKDLDGYFLGNRTMPWWLVVLSIMGTQASAITFLSAPGQAYTDGMRFVQYYFGLPIAMVVISIVFVPIFRKLKVYTAYEYLEQRFDMKTRTLTAFLFLLSRGLSTGISIYAPSIIISSLLGWNIYLTNLVMGGLLIIYTVSGGAKAVAYTQQLQFLIIMAGMFIAGYMVVHLLPPGVGFKEALQTSGNLGKMNIITSGVTDKGFNWNDRYNMWSGVIGGFFLALSYFGTDQSQVGRYLTAKSNRESRLGLLANGLIKVPMQFGILLVGVLVFAFYQFRNQPVFFNQTLVTQAKETSYKIPLEELEQKFRDKMENQQVYQVNIVKAKTVPGAENMIAVYKDSLKAGAIQMESLRKEYKAVLKQAVPAGESNDTNYIFLYFVTQNLPKGLVGLLIAVIILAAWGSIAAALNSLASCTVVDIHKNIFKKDCSSEKSYRLSWQYTLGWGLFSIFVAMFATNMGSLIEAVNILGSLFYGVILGVFLVAFMWKKIKGNAIFWAAVVSQFLIIGFHLLQNSKIYHGIKFEFLWYNPAGVILVFFFSFLFTLIFRNKTQPVALSVK